MEYFLAKKTNAPDRFRENAQGMEAAMGKLVVTLKENGPGVFVDGPALIKVQRRGARVRLHIDAPSGTLIMREQIMDGVQPRRMREMVDGRDQTAGTKQQATGRRIQPPPAPANVNRKSGFFV